MSVAAWLFANASSCLAGGIDHRLTFDQSGIWKRSNQQVLLDTLVVGEIAGALWEGGDTELGRTFWQAMDASAIGAVSSEGLKHVFTRSRPIQSDNPHLWFQGGGHYSFPSGEVTGVTAIVTPFLFEYGPRYPLTYALAALPLYDGVARMKAQAHWQTDVLASWALGTAAAYYAHQRDSPLIRRVAARLRGRHQSDLVRRRRTSHVAVRTSNSARGLTGSPRLCKVHLDARGRILAVPALASGWPEIPGSFEDAARATSSQVYDLVRYVEQSDPQVVAGLLSALSQDGATMTAVGAAIAAIAVRRLSDRNGTANPSPASRA